MHCACLPFPSPQGTQAAIAAMLETLREAGRGAPLLCYPHGDRRIDPHVDLVRLAMPALTRSLRSGPSISKVALDIGMIVTLRRRPHGEPLVCHHAEAAWAARLAGREYHYVAHTALEDELASYVPHGSPRSDAWLARAGRAIDAFAIGGAVGCAAVAPALGRRLAARHGRSFDYLPIPWAPGGRGSRADARRHLGLSEDALVVLYSGNLDAYQNWSEALEVVRVLRERGVDAWLLVATESAPAPLVARASAMQLASVQIRGLSSEPARQRAHAAADVALVPRRSPGGVPVKLLDALARGVPVVTTRAGAAGLALGEAVAIAESTSDLADACRVAAYSCEVRAAAGRAFLEANHGPSTFLEAYSRFLRLS
jgi:glycosyltransferase involved in cell wall biosynthesis